MSSSNLDFLIRKNKGKLIIDKYYSMFLLTGFTNDELVYIDLKKSDELIRAIKESFSTLENQKVEILASESNYHDSALLNSMLAKDDSKCSYVFSDDVYYCGMYSVSNKSALKCCLNVAKLGYSNTCFILDENLRFSFTINYYDSGDSELKNKFDIQLKSI